MNSTSSFRRTSTLAALAVVFSLLVAIPLSAGTVHEGSWTKKRYSIEGTWQIVEEGGKHWVILDGKFKTKNAPDLKLFLSKTSAGDLGDKNAISGAAFIAELKSNKGAQRYEIPASIDVDAYNTLVLHCEKYTKLWGVAPL